MHMKRWYHKEPGFVKNLKQQEQFFKRLTSTAGSVDY